MIDALSTAPFSHDRYTITRKFFTFLGRDFRVFDPLGNPCLYALHKLFTFKTEWNIFADEGYSLPLVRVKAREAIAINITTDILDAVSGAKTGSVRAKGFKSILRDTWEVLDGSDNVIGEFQEDSNGLVRRMLPSFFGMAIIPGRWHLSVNGQLAMALEEERKFFTKTFHATLVPGVVDPRFALGCALLALMKEISREQR
jgi:hypothetical protein